MLTGKHYNSTKAYVRDVDYGSNQAFPGRGGVQCGWRPAALGVYGSGHPNALTLCLV